MLLGVNPEIVRWFSLQFEERRISKNYVAVVHGCFEEPLGSGLVWDRPLSPEAGGRDHPAGKGKKVPCITRIQVLDQSPHYALIACSLLTGRKHQIRRHAKLAGHPVLGDSRYGSKRAVEFIRNRHGFTRLALHSHILELELADTHQTERFESPIPPEFLQIMEDDKLES